MNCCLETNEEYEHRVELVMQGNDNFIPRYKQKNKEDVRLDKKRDKKRPKDQWKKERKLKVKELEE